MTTQNLALVTEKSDLRSGHSSITGKNMSTIQNVGLVSAKNVRALDPFRSLGKIWSCSRRWFETLIRVYRAQDGLTDWEKSGDDPKRCFIR